MNIDFATIIVILVFISGLTWLFDVLFLAPKRRAKLQAIGTDVAAEVLEEAAREPLLVDYARSFFPIFLIVLVLRSFLVEPFRIPSGSMMPTLLIGDFILVNKYTYGIRLPVLNTKVFEIGVPERGDIIVFRYPEDPSIPFIKRVVGVPGDRISYRDKALSINGKRVSQEDLGLYEGLGAGESMTGAEHRGEQLGDVEHDILIVPYRPTRDVPERVIPEGHFFVLGDNRDNSKDSRYWGLVPDGNLIGKAFMIWMNWDSDNGGVDWSRIGDRIQ